MPRARRQFRLSTLLWLTLAVACFFGGNRLGRIQERSAIEAEANYAIESTTSDLLAAPLDSSARALLNQPAPSSAPLRAD
jgi:hypothetical protein